MTIQKPNGATNQAAQPDTSIYISRFAGFTEDHGELLRYPTWNAFFKLLKDSMLYEGDPQPVWSPSIFAGNSRRSHDIKRVGGMVLQYPAGQVSARQAFEFWSEDAFGGTTLCFAYKTGEYASDKPSFCVVIPFATAITSEEFTEVSTAIVGMATKQGHEVNAASQDPAGTWGWANAHSQCLGPREESRLLDPRTLMPAVSIAAAPVTGNSSKPLASSSFSLEKWLSDVRLSAPVDTRNVLNKVSFIAGLQIGKGNLDEAAALKELIKAGIDAGLGAAKAEQIVQVAIQEGKAKAAEQGGSEKWEDSRLKKTKGGSIDGTQVSNLILILKEHPSWRNVVRYSEFDHRVHFVAPPFGGTFYAGKVEDEKWMEDNDLTCVRSWFETMLDMGVSKESIMDALVAVGRSQPFHQVRDWLDDLAWDGVRRIDTWLETYCGAEIETDSQKIAVPAMSKRWMISAVARAYYPGAKVDCTLVLEGEQSIKKSTTFATLVPNEAWFSDERLNLDSKDTLQQIQGKWIIEIGELASFRGKANEEIKHFLTKRADDFRLPYGKINQPYPRQCVFGGTVNDSEYLSDPTGNRRFYPVRCHGLDRLGGKIDIAGLRKVRDQLWAEAAHLYKQGEAWWLTEEEDEAARLEQEARFTADAWESRVAQWVSTYDAEGILQDKFTMDAVLHGAVNIEPARQGKTEQSRMKTILARLGFLRRQVSIDGKREWRYCRSA